MPKIVPIVEGKGEVAAFPKLLHRLLHENQRYDIQVVEPKSAHGCNNLKKPNGLEKFLRYAAIEPGCSAILILMDADGDCPRKLARDFASRVQTAGLRFPTVIVIAKCEYEAWFLASLDTMTGKPLTDGVMLPVGLEFTGAIEAERNVKGWLTERLPGSRAYKEDEDQAAFTQMIDIELAKQNSRSFRRLCHAVEEIIAAIVSGTIVITPAAR